MLSRQSIMANIDDSHQAITTMVEVLGVCIIPCAELRTKQKVNFFFDIATPHPSQHPFGKKPVVATQQSIFSFRHSYKHYSAIHNR